MTSELLHGAVYVASAGCNILHALDRSLSLSSLSQCVDRQPCLSQVCIARPSGCGDHGSRSGLRLLCCKSAPSESFRLPCSGWDLILDRHEHLQHVHLQNLVPHTLACGACRVHVSYVARPDVCETDRTEDFVKWASSELWVTVGAQLSSINVQDRNRSLEPYSTQEVGLRGDTCSSQTVAASQESAYLPSY